MYFFRVKTKVTISQVVENPEIFLNADKIVAN
jgi:hypothetical protein